MKERLRRLGPPLWLFAAGAWIAMAVGAVATGTSLDLGRLQRMQPLIGTLLAAYLATDAAQTPTQAELPGHLGRREQQVAQLVATGRSNKEIAAQLELSEFTVRNQLHSVFRKLGVTSRAALAARLGSRR